MKLLGAITRWLFILLIPLFLFTSTMRWEVGEPRLYRYALTEYGVSQRTGIEDEELLKAYRGLIHYFNSDEELAHITVVKGGKNFTLFNEREVLHLRDVKELIQLGYHIQEIAFAYLLIYVIAISLRGKRDSWRKLITPLMWGSGLTVGIMLMLGAGMFLNFEQLFIQFHLISFDNPFWQLDPSRDYLIMMFPTEFFRHAALLGAAAITAEALILEGTAGWLMAANKRRARSGK